MIWQKLVSLPVQKIEFLSFVVSLRRSMHLIDYDELAITSKDQQEYYYYHSFQALQSQYSQNEVLSELANR